MKYGLPLRDMENIDNIEILGKKLGMTQVYTEDNKLVPVTVVEAGPCPIVQVKTKDSDGYTAVQIAFGPQKEQRMSNAAVGHFKKAGVAPHSEMSEFRTENVNDFKVGESITVSSFKAGEKIDVTGKTKGRGFQGVVKRWGFGGGPASHGHMSHRRGGSYGHCQTPGEIVKGRKMPGHMGNANRSTQNLEVVKVLEDKNILLIKGSFPGAKGGIVKIRRAIKRRTQAN